MNRSTVYILNHELLRFVTTETGLSVLFLSFMCQARSVQLTSTKFRQTGHVLSTFPL